ncbi:MAG: hypothetical protein R2704_09665 [Microthrixaceae bacterium]
MLNRANSKVKLDVGEVERTLQLTADSLIPSDIVVPQAVNKGVLVVMHAPFGREQGDQRAGRTGGPATPAPLTTHIPATGVEWRGPRIEVTEVGRGRPPIRSATVAAPSESPAMGPTAHPGPERSSLFRPADSVVARHHPPHRKESRTCRSTNDCTQPKEPEDAPANKGSDPILDDCASGSTSS